MTESFEDLVLATVPVLDAAVRALHRKIFWEVVEDSSDYHLTLASETQGLRFHLKLVPELTPEILEQELGFAEMALAALPDADSPTALSFLLVGLELSRPDEIEAVAARFNGENFTRAPDDSHQAFVGYLGMAEDEVKTPAASGTLPALSWIDLGGTPLSEAPGRPPTRPPSAAPPRSELQSLPPLSRPPEKPPAEHAAIVEDIAGLVETKLKDLDPDIEWIEEPDHEAYFDQVLVGTKEPGRYRFYLKAVDLLTPEGLDELLQYAEQLVSIFTQSKVTELHSYLLFGRSARNVAPLYAKLEELNRRLWETTDPFATRAFVAFLPGLNAVPALPGVDYPDPPLHQLQLVSRQLAMEATHILVVDDDPLATAMLEDTLSEFGFAVTVVVDWQGFRDAIMSTRFAAVVLDVNMPNVTGDKMALFVGNFIEAPRPRILLHSGMEEPELKVLAAQVGAHGYICKGAGDKQLMAAVEAAVSDFEAEAG